MGILPDWLGQMFGGGGEGSFQPTGGNGILNFGNPQSGAGGSFMDNIANNRQALLGLGMGLMGGSSKQEAWSNALQGMQRGGLMDSANAKATLEKQQKEKRAAALKALAQKYGLDPSVSDDPELAQKVLQQRMEPDNGSIVQSNGKYYRIFKDPSKPAQEVSGVEAQREWKTAANPATGETVVFDANDPTQRKEIFPGVKTPSDLKPVTKKTADGEVTIGYVTPQGKMISVQEAETAFGATPGSTGGDGMSKKFKDTSDELRAKQVDDIQKTGMQADATARSAASAGDFIKRFVPDKAIGPWAGSALNRTATSWLGFETEKTRQLAEQQLNALGADYRRSVYQGTGAVSDKETEYALRVLGNPASFDKGTVLAAVKHIEEKSSYNAKFRDFFQQNAEKFKYNPTDAWMEYNKQNPYKANDAIVKAAGLGGEVSDGYNDPSSKPKSGVPELKKGESFTRGKVNIKRLD